MKRSVVEHAVFGVLGGLVSWGDRGVVARPQPSDHAAAGRRVLCRDRAAQRAAGRAPPGRRLGMAAAVTLLELATGLIETGG